MKISSLLIGMVIVGAFMIGLSNMIGGLNDSYGTDINESAFDQFKQIEKINNLTEKTKEASEGITDNPSALDKLSSFFNAGIVAAKTTYSAYDLLTNFINVGMYAIGLGAFAAALKAMLFVAFFIGVVIAMIIKWRT